MAKILLNERNIADYMKRNKCDREEAIELIKYDNAIEGGEETEYDLTPEQVKNVQEMARKIDHAKPTVVKRERKPNEIKEGIISALAEFLENECEFEVKEQITYCGDVTITNKNRMIHFSCGDKEYDLQLIEKRPKK